jgi:MoxR-like ATPase
MGVPGLAKTLLVRKLAETMSLKFSRIQFTPDLMPMDITGTDILQDQAGGRREFEFVRGPVFANLVLADEINRAPPKTQAAMLEAMQEQKVTVVGKSFQLDPPFLVLATQNPVEQEGVYRLPEAQLDRFLLRVPMGYPGHEPEVEMLRLHSRPIVEPEQVFTPEGILELQSQLAGVFAAETLLHYIVTIAEASRRHPDVALGASPRAALSLLRCARARALLDGRHYCTHEDVQAVAAGVLGHRLIVRPEAEIEGKLVTEVIAEVLAQVPVLEA